MLPVKAPVIMSGQFMSCPERSGTQEALQSLSSLPWCSPNLATAQDPMSVPQGCQPPPQSCCSRTYLQSPAQPSDAPKSQPDLTSSPGRCLMPGLELPLCPPQLPCLIWQLLRSTPALNHCLFCCHQHKSKPATSGSWALCPSLQIVSMEIPIMQQGTDTSKQLLKKTTQKLLIYMLCLG